ncbi:MAG TPA: isoprenylcysteine carboxylmethyltransferase family protein [Bacteroidota bacterium]|nr:isoprenylcysteine carboxylmethyltransferase family protein [Bacteroidota bacterium]
MRAEYDIVAQAVAVGVLLCWFVFAAVFFFRKRPPKSAERQRDPKYITGVLLVGVGYALVWSLRRPWFSPFLPVGGVFDVILAAITIALSVSSVVLVQTAVQTLGKQWSMAARLVEGHDLVTDGPYELVRHPIYTGMLGMMLATGVAISHWYVVVVALFFGWAGTTIRIRSEEQLLRKNFGASFDEYARRVPALIPHRLFRQRSSTQ